MGVYSRWGSIISLTALDWGCIRNLNGWGCNQEGGSNRADTVSEDFEVLKKIAIFASPWGHAEYRCFLAKDGPNGSKKGPIQIFFI